MAKIIDPKKRKNNLEDIDAARLKRFTRFRDRLIRVRTTNRPLTILQRQDFFVCGYCGQRMALYSPGFLTGREKDPKLYYGCSHRCEPSSIHRYQFIDNKLLSFIYDRLVGFFPKAKGSRSKMKFLDEGFKTLGGLEEKRGRLLEALSHAAYNRDDVLRELIQTEEEIEKLRAKLSGVSSKHPEKSALFAPIFLAKSADELQSLDLLHRRELVRATIRRIRYFNETLIVRVAPLDDEERRVEEKGGGKIFNIHLAFDPSKLDLESILESDDEDGDEPDKDVEKPHIDLDFIMNDEEESEYAKYIRSTEQLDVELIKTEPGSPEEEAILKKRAESEKEKK